MDNVKYEVKGDTLIITVPNLKADGKKSSSGKTKLIAGTGGFTTTGHASGAKFSLNVTIPAE